MISLTVCNFHQFIFIDFANFFLLDTTLRFSWFVWYSGEMMSEYVLNLLKTVLELNVLELCLWWYMCPIYWKPMTCYIWTIKINTWRSDSPLDRQAHYFGNTRYFLGWFIQFVRSNSLVVILSKRAVCRLLF